VLLQGVLYYAPNTDAATWLATTIAPALRRLVPDAVVRLVGDTNPTVDALHDPPRVTVTGFVTDIAVELSGADLVAVPLRSGSGTRVKVLEAFAHRLPVVSTTLGAEGLGAEDGVHVLLADDADAFARACARVLTDAALRARMTAAAHALFLRDHTRAAGRRSVHELVAPLVGNA
jgi:glycosyltransferase involved in cell wall biosynthesis